MKFAAKSLLIAIAMSTFAVSLAAEDIDINLTFERGQQHRVQMQLEHEGKVIMQKDPERDEEEFRMLPMKTLAKLDYFQRFTGKSGDMQAIRYYDQAKGSYAILKGKTGSDLLDKNKLVVVRIKSKSGKRIQMASVAETLAQYELELIRNPVDPLAIGSLINHKDTEVGDDWKPSDDGLANFLSVDRVIRNDVKVRLKEVENGEATLHVTGKLRAGVDDVSTDIEVAGTIKIKLGKTQEILQAKLNMREIRQPGQVAPGFDGKSSITLELVADDSCEFLTNESLAKFTKGRVIEQCLQWQSPGLKLKYDPRWRVIASEPEAAIMRFVSEGNLLAQCNIVQLPARPSDNPLSLADYKKEVARIIAADEVATIVDAKEFNTESSARALVVEVEGAESGVPVSWLYYHVNDKDGRRMTFVFTLEREIMNQFLPADREMINGLAFGVRPTKRALKSQSAREADSKTSSRR